VFKQTAAIRISNLEEMADSVQAFLALPPNTGRRIGMVSGGGAIGVAAADACSAVGLEMEPLAPEVQQELSRVLPPAGTATRNPVDIGAPLVPPPLFHKVLEIVAAVDSVDTVIATQALFYIFRANGPLLAGKDAVQALMKSPVDVRDRFGKPVIIILPLGGEEVEAVDAERQRREARDVYRQNGIFSMPTLERATRAIANVVKYYERGGSPV
jgi:acyl-CoA synthetase (NDP forming)